MIPWMLWVLSGLHLIQFAKLECIYERSKCERSDSLNLKSPQRRKIHESVKDIGYKYATSYIDKKRRDKR